MFRCMLSGKGFHCCVALTSIVLCHMVYKKKKEKKFFLEEAIIGGKEVSGEIIINTH